ncbi:MAG: hypothetical protein Cons2KO_11030 [Congregibacter sp.]
MIYPFDHAHNATVEQITQRVGGKGASLWAMTTQLQLPTPPGFTIGCDYSAIFDREGITQALAQQIDTHLQRLELALGRTLGGTGTPLLLSVRSGAPVSMPGMMETVLNVGLTADNLSGLAAASGSPIFALDSYARFLGMYCSCVLHADVPTELKAGRPDAGESDLEQRIATLREIAESHGAGDDLANPRRLLLNTIGAVFRSRHSAPARAYIEREGLVSDLGTSVTVQAMVFGNMDVSSGTGVVFSRDPSTGVNELTGDWLPQAQGEDVVAGLRATRTIEDLASEFPSIYRELGEHAARLENWYQDMVDIEFTIEQGRLWILQARRGKRSLKAAARIAVELAENGTFGTTRASAVQRVGKETILNAARESTAGGQVFTAGIGASPGTATGRVAMTSEAAIELAEEDEPVILVRRETSPSDIHGMSAATGILTSLGGLMSHAAVVARDWNLPAVVGAADIDIDLDKNGFRVGGHFVAAGETLSIDGASGSVYLGDVSRTTQQDPYIEKLREWASEPAANTPTPAKQQGVTTC